MFDGDLLGVVLILSTIGFFLSFIVVVVSVARTWNNIAMVRMTHSLVHELLSQGYTVEDVERLAVGGPRWKQRFRKMFQSTRVQIAKMAARSGYQNQPAPPYKQPV